MWKTDQNNILSHIHHFYLNSCFKHLKFWCDRTLSTLHVKLFIFGPWLSFQPYCPLYHFSFNHYSFRPVYWWYLKLPYFISQSRKLILFLKTHFLPCNSFLISLQSSLPKLCPNTVFLYISGIEYTTNIWLVHIYSSGIRSTLLQYKNQILFSLVSLVSGKSFVLKNTS